MNDDYERGDEFNNLRQDVIDATEHREKPDQTILKLYWVSTEDHHEDWFILSKSAKEARDFHEDYEGYGRGDASSILVINETIFIGRTRHAQSMDLEELGAEVDFRKENWFSKRMGFSRRVASFGNVYYVEGEMDDLMAQVEETEELKKVMADEALENMDPEAPVN